MIFTEVRGYTNQETSAGSPICYAETQQSMRTWTTSLDPRCSMLAITEVHGRTNGYDERCGTDMTNAKTPCRTWRNFGSEWWGESTEGALIQLCYRCGILVTALQPARGIMLATDGRLR